MFEPKVGTDSGARAAARPRAGGYELQRPSATGKGSWGSQEKNALWGTAHRRFRMPALSHESTGRLVEETQ